MFSAQGAGTADDVLFLVFNQDIGSAALDSILFSFGGAIGDTVVTATDGLVFAYQPMALANGHFNVIEVTGLDNLPIPLTTAHMVALPNPLDLPFAARNASRIPVKTGPAISRIEVFRGLAGDYVTTAEFNSVSVWFTHRITAGVSLADARLDFTFPEAGTAGAPPTAIHAPDANQVVIVFNDNDTQGAMREGITSIRLAGANVLSGRIDDGAGAVTGPTELSSDPRWHCSINEGPILLRASLNALTSTVTLVFSDDIDANTVVTPGVGTFTFDAGSYASIASNDGDNVLTLIGVAGAPTTVTHSVSGGVLDYQGNSSTGLGVSISLITPPMIILANHDDNGTDALNDDRITAWFDVNFSTAPVIGNFGFRGFDGSGATTALPATGNQVQIIDLTDAWEQGDRLFLDSATPITYDGGANATPDSSNAWIRDGSAPRFVGLATNGTLTADINDVAFVGIDEFGPQDDGSYALVYSRRVIESQPDFDFKTQNQNNAAVLIDPSAGLQGIDLNTELAVACAIDTMSTDSAGDTLNAGDDVFFWGVVVDKEGNWDPTNCYLLGSLVAGPLACPRDTLVSDNDAIHVYGVSPTSEGPYTEETHFICGDENSAPTDADSVRVYADMGRVNLLGSAVVNADGSWGPIELANPLGTTVPVLWVVSVQNTGASAVESFDICPIINDNLEPTIASVEDPTNALKCYSGGDTLRLLIDVNDPATPDGIFLNPTAKNALMHVWVDLTEYVTTAGADSVVLVSLGANREDDDNDWIDASANPTFAGNGVRDYPEPFVDEDGNGAYTPGETFIDISGAGYTDGVYDGGDTNLDSNDP
ncbi:MAG: hypothetical protein HKN21_10515, partial [Candidatus Eisenbacteria bacterium]|nr:hypothetical protein [Candidatus Eisenbacteria bacterium]